jgi:ribosomal protein S18 acetylase RimI-like enzyme
MNFLIRDATPDDAKGIAVVHVKTWQSAYRGQIPDSILDSLSVKTRAIRRKELLRELPGDLSVLVAEVDGGIVGFIDVGSNRDDDVDAEVGELKGFIVDPDYMNKGIGSELMKQGLQILRKKGYKKATLWLLDTNENSRRFYTNRGWVVEGRTKVDKRDDFDLHETRYVINLD